MPGTWCCFLAARSLSGRVMPSPSIGAYCQPQAEKNKNGSSQCDSSNVLWCQAIRVRAISGRVTRNVLGVRCHVDENVLFVVILFFYLVPMNT
jgi:hypothetical protein